MAITFQLVTGTEIIYPTSSTDPYTGSFNSQLQSTLTSEVGESNYDIGHLFNYGGNNGNARIFRKFGGPACILRRVLLQRSPIWQLLWCRMGLLYVHFWSVRPEA